MPVIFFITGLGKVLSITVLTHIGAWVKTKIDIESIIFFLFLKERAKQ